MNEVNSLLKDERSKITCVMYNRRYRFTISTEKVGISRPKNISVAEEEETAPNRFLKRSVPVQSLNRKRLHSLIAR